MHPVSTTSVPRQTKLNGKRSQLHLQSSNCACPFLVGRSSNSTSQLASQRTILLAARSSVTAMLNTRPKGSNCLPQSIEWRWRCLSQHWQSPLVSPQKATCRWVKMAPIPCAQLKHTLTQPKQRSSTWLMLFLARYGCLYRLTTV